MHKERMVKPSSTIDHISTERNSATYLEERVRVLSGFGLTCNQAKVYYGILLLGTTSIEPVSKASAVRREDVYRILPKLHEIGLIERIPVNPTRVRAIPEKEAISILMKHKNDEALRTMNQLSQQADDFFRHFEPLEPVPPINPDIEQFFLLNGQDAADIRLHEIITGARKSLVISGGEEFIRSAFASTDISMPDKTPRLQIRVITDQKQGDTISNYIDQVSSRIGRSVMKYSINLHGSYCIADGREAIFDISEVKSQERKFLWTNNASFISLLQKSFNRSWDSPD